MIGKLSTVEISTWYWLALGVVLVLGEIFMPGGILVWIGVGAAVVGIVSVFVKLTLIVKLAIWMVVAGILLVLWFKLFRDSDSSREGRAEATLGYTGTLVRVVAPGMNGSVRFNRPILGEEVWDCESSVRIDANTRVKVVAAVGREGRRLRVTAV
ncbi:MAG: NfeD family protein [Rhodocyclaceae bacterium]